MKKVKVQVEVGDEHYHAYEREAGLRGVPVETLVEQTVNCLLREMEREEDSGCSPADAPNMS